jgi:hypothetical protein
VFSPDGKKVGTVNLGDVPYDENNPWYLMGFAVDGKGSIDAATSRGTEVFDAQGRPGRQLASYRAQNLEVDCEGKLHTAGFIMTDYKSFLERAGRHPFFEAP